MSTVTIYSITHTVPYRAHPNAPVSSEFISATQAVAAANKLLAETLDSTHRPHAEMVLEEEFTPELIAAWGLTIEASEIEVDE